MSLHDQNERERCEHWLGKAVEATEAVLSVLQEPDFPRLAILRSELGGEFGEELENWLTELDETNSRVVRQLREFC